MVLVVVVDEDGKAIPNANFALARQGAPADASFLTDKNGRRAVVLSSTPGEARLAVRKLGFLPSELMIRLGGDTVIAAVTLRQAAVQLEGVKVAAKRSRYHLDANEIAASDSAFEDALAVVRRLRPEMFGDRLRGQPGCGVATEIWVNGRRIVFPPRNVVLPPLPRRASTSMKTITAKGKDGRPQRYTVLVPSPVGEAAASQLVRAVLASIKPDHVAEMTYLDCFDNSMARLHTNNAIIVVLKPLVDYDDQVGSISRGDTTRK